MRVYTGDAIGCLKQSDIEGKTVELVSKPLVASRRMAIDYLASVDEGRGLLIGRGTGLVEYFDTLSAKALYICPVPGGSIIFCALISPQLLAVVTRRGWLILIDHLELLSDDVAAKQVKLPQVEDDDEDPVCLWAQEFLTQYSDWTDVDRRPTWVKTAVRVFADVKEESDDDDDDEAGGAASEVVLENRITSAFCFTDLQGKLCLGVAGYTIPLTVYKFDDQASSANGLTMAYKTTHSGRIFARDRKTKIMACGYLGRVAQLDAVYTADQRGKCRFYFLQPDSLWSEGRETGPVITFQMTQDNTCPHLVRLMSDDYHSKVLHVGGGESAEDTGVESEGDTEDPESEGQSSKAEETDETDANDPNTSDDNLKRLESRLLNSDETHCWLFGVGDAKGGAYVITVKWAPSSDRCKQKAKAYEETGQLEEYYDRTKIRRRMRVNVIYKIGQLIDTSPLDRGDRSLHESLRGAIEISVSGSFKGIPGAVSAIEYAPEFEESPEMICLAGLSRRLYVFMKDNLGRWKQAYKINLKNKITAACITA